MGSADYPIGQKRTETGRTRGGCTPEPGTATWSARRPSRREARIELRRSVHAVAQPPPAAPSGAERRGTGCNQGSASRGGSAKVPDFLEFSPSDSERVGLRGATDPDNRVSSDIHDDILTRRRFLETDAPRDRGAARARTPRAGRPRPRTPRAGAPPPRGRRQGARTRSSRRTRVQRECDQRESTRTPQRRAVRTCGRTAYRRRTRPCTQSQTHLRSQGRRTVRLRDSGTDACRGFVGCRTRPRETPRRPARRCGRAPTTRPHAPARPHASGTHAGRLQGNHHPAPRPRPQSRSLSLSLSLSRLSLSLAGARSSALPDRQYLTPLRNRTLTSASGDALPLAGLIACALFGRHVASRP